jgi:hypothetical protein
MQFEAALHNHAASRTNAAARQAEVVKAAEADLAELDDPIRWPHGATEYERQLRTDNVTRAKKEHAALLREAEVASAKPFPMLWARTGNAKWMGDFIDLYNAAREHNRLAPSSPGIGG